MRYDLFIVCVVAAVLTAGCFGASDNPREGGLFGYSPEAYEKRQEERRTTLQGLERSTKEEKAGTASLEGDRKSREAEVARQKKQLNTLNKDLAATSRKLKEAKAADAAQQKRLDELRERGSELSRSISSLEKSTVDPAARQAELERLKKEYEELEREADALSRL